MVTFKLICDECKREVTYDAIVLHPSCYQKVMDELAGRTRLVRERELFDGVPLAVPPEEMQERRILP